MDGVERRGLAVDGTRNRPTSQVVGSAEGPVSSVVRKLEGEREGRGSVNADTLRPLVSSLFFSSPSPLLPLSPLFSLSGFDPFTHQHAMYVMPWRNMYVVSCFIWVGGKTYQYILYWTSPTDAPRRELSAGILHTTRAADARSPYNF